MAEKTAMPYDDNVWYHVTDRKHLPQIQQHGLRGSQYGTDRNFPLPVEENAVYLHPNIGMAHAWAQGQSGEWGHTRLHDPAILRIQGIDRDNIAPDHEQMQNWRESAEQNIEHSEDEDSGEFPFYREVLAWIDKWEDAHPEHEKGVGWSDQQYERDIAMLRDMPPAWRKEIGREIATHSGDSVMHYGPIHPNQIEVGKMIPEEDAYQQWTDQHQPEGGWTQEQMDEGEDLEAFDQWRDAEPVFSDEDVMDMQQAGYEDPEDDSYTHRWNWSPLRTQKFAVEEDNWTSPRSDKLVHNVEMPGNAPGLNPEGDLPINNLKRPCYCNVGLMSPHEWKPNQCEHDMPMRKAAAIDQNWVYFDGNVGFGRHWWEIVKNLAQDHDEDTQNYLSNMISRNSLPTGLDLAVGTMQGGRPQIFSSNVDRNAVWDAVMQTAPS